MELLVRVVDKVSDDKAKNAQLTKRGDVIAVKDDGSDWGLVELLNPEWRLVKCDLPKDQAVALLAPETPPANKPSATVAKRAFKLDLDTLGIAPLDGRGVPLSTRTATFDKDQIIVPDHVKVSADVLAARVTKPATAADGSAIGPASDVIGPK